MQPASANHFSLSIASRSGDPTLVIGSEMEQMLDVGRCYPARDRSRSLPGYAIHIHGYFLDETEQILEHLYRSCPGADLWITTDRREKREVLQRILGALNADGRWPRVEILVVGNTGRNIGALLGEVYYELVCYPVVLHVHSKRSAHAKFAVAWREDLLACLAGSEASVQAILSSFASHPGLGLVMPRPFEGLRRFVNWGANYDVAAEVVAHMFPQHDLDPMAPLVFPAGMMLWFRPQIFGTLRHSYKHWEPHLAEPLPRNDGTVLHALERLVAHICEAEGYQWALCHRQGECAYPPGETTTLSVWQPRRGEYVRATAALAARLRRCERRIKQLESARPSEA